MKQADYEKYKETLKVIDENIMDFLEKKLEKKLPQLRHNTIAMLYILQRVVTRVVFAASTPETVDQTVNDFAESVKYMVKEAKYEPKKPEGMH